MSESRFVWRVRATALLIVVGFMGVLGSWLWRTPATHVSSGMFQGDMPTYMCSARMAAQSPTLITHANPHDMREPPVPLALSLPISGMGLLLHVLSPGALENMLRLVFGVATYLALAGFLRRMFGSGAWFWAAFVLIGVCAGVSWIAALHDCPNGATGIACVREVERGHYMWGLSLLRNVALPLELIYHTLLFAQLSALTDRRLRLANALFLLGVLCNPFLAIQMLGAQLACALLLPGSPAVDRIAPFATAVILFAYYGWVLPQDPVAASVQHQHAQAFVEPLALRDFVLGHGPAAFGLLVLGAPSFRRWLRGQPYALPLVAVTLWTVLLTQHPRFGLDHALQPLHFTRGYLATGLTCLLLLFARHTVDARPALARRVTPALIGWVLLTLPDNLCFLYERWRVMPTEVLLTAPRAVYDTAQFLAQQPNPRRAAVIDTRMSRYLCAQTQTRVLLGTQYTTPDFELRAEQAMHFYDHAATARDIASYAIDTVILPSEQADVVHALERNPNWRRAYTNAGFSVFFRTF